MIGLFAVTSAGQRAAAELASRMGPEAVLTDGPVGPALRRLWSTLDAVVLFLDTSSAVRLIAPLLRDERTDPGVVCVDEDQRFAVAISGGSPGGANALAQQTADVLDCVPVTSADGLGTSPLDELVEQLDAAVDGDVLACGTAVLDGERVRLLNPRGFPLPALPENVRADVGQPQWTIVLDDRRPEEPDDDRTLRLIPHTLVVGVGSGKGVSRTEVTDLLATLDGEHGLDPRAVRAFATVEHRVDEPGVLDAVQDMGFWHSADGGDELALLSYPAEVLAGVEVPNPSDDVLAEVGTASVAEAAALHGARELGGGARVELVVPKIKSANVTIAAARMCPRGRVAVIGLGPGDPDLRTPRAEAEVRRAGVVIGPGEVLDQVRHLVRPGTELRTVPDEGRSAAALEAARSGRAVALVVPGDAHADVESVLRHAADGVELVVVPGVPSTEHNRW